jgi:hypothetical protein
MNLRAAAIVVSLLVVFTLVSTGQEKPKSSAGAQASSGKAEDKAAKTRGGGADSNVKEGKDQAAKNDPAQEPAAPPEKGGKKERGVFDCWVTADNYTGWWIDIFVDGTYRGQVSPWGRGTVNAGAGGTTLYGRADFTDGAVRTWGPRAFICASNGQFSWRLDP